MSHIPTYFAGVDEVAKFLVDNHHLSKAMIGDYLGDRRNTEVLTAFIRCVFSSGGGWDGCVCMLACVCVCVCVHVWYSVF